MITKEKMEAISEINVLIKEIKEYQKTACPWDYAKLEVAKGRLKKARKIIIFS